MDMRSFVAEHTERPGSSKGQAGRPQTGNRVQLGANAKIPLGGAALRQQAPSQQQSSGRRRSGDNVREPHHQVQQRQHPALSSHVKHELFQDTDNESIDTTIHDHEIEHGNGRFINEHGEFYNGEPEENEDEESSGDEEEEGAVDNGFQGNGNGPDHFQAQHIGTQMLQTLSSRQQQEIEMRMGRGTFDGDNSYPTTTSGGPEDEDQEDEFPEEGLDDQSRISPTPQPEALGRSRRQPAAQLAQRSASAQGDLRPTQNQPTMWQKGAHVRGINRSAAGPNEPAAQYSHRHPVVDIRNSQPPTYSQSTRHHNERSSANSTVHPPNQRHVNQALPQRGASARTSTIAPVREPKPVKPAAPIVPPNSNKPVTPQPHEYEIARNDSLDPIVDYDLPVLFKMDYDELKTEDFDKVPRASESVIPDDMSGKPLVERLQYVQANLDHAHQSEFFGQLKLAEWEDAGDWFLEQFGNIIKRARDARRKKRDLAAAFEQEVEKRHRHVAKKRKCVETALDGMNKQGQNLIPPPRTPGRGSKSPAKR